MSQTAGRRTGWVRTHRTLAAVIALAVVLVGFVAFRVLRRSDTATAATTTSLATASVQTLSQSVSATGTINPAVQSNLRFAVSGTIASVAVKVGDTVTAGQAVASVTATDLQTAVTLASANANSARANLSTVRSSSSSTSTQIAAASAQVTAADAKLASAEADLKNATLVSPIAGTVATVNVAVGDQVSGGGTSSGGSGGSGGSGSAASGSSSAQIVVISTDSWVVATSVTSADLPSIKPGLQAQITPTGARSLVFGTVSTVGVVATTSSGVASFPVTIAVTGKPTGLYAGSSATVAIIVKEIADALTVPTASIRTENGQAVVSKLVNGVATTTPVQLGMVQGALTQVTSGLAEGDQVVVEGRTGTGSGQQSTGTRTRSSGQGTGGFGGFGGQAPAGDVPAGGAPPAGAGGGQ